MLTLCQISFLIHLLTAVLPHSMLGFLFLRSSSFIFSVSLSAALTDSPFLIILSQTYSFLSSLIVIIVLPCAAERVPHDHILYLSGSFNSLSEFAIYALIFLKRLKPALCETRMFRSSHYTMLLQSDRDFRCIFMIATIIFLFFVKIPYYTRTFDFSNQLLGHLLSPATSFNYSVPFLMIMNYPFSLMEFARSFSFFIEGRGWSLFGLMSLMSI